jgi:CDP-diacylglycerol---serine O-phosphatidyltransferase
MSKFRFRKRKQKQLRTPRELPVRAMLPNMITLMSAASGITSIRFSCDGQWRLAVIAISISCFLDALDGRMARMLKVTSKLGEQLDSLADFVCFGVAPAIFTYFWIMEVVPAGSPLYPIRGLFWTFALFYALCCAFRLARFNIMIDDGPTQPYWKHFFVGLPSPGAAGLVLTPAILDLHFESSLLQSPWTGCAMLILCGILMASRAPTLSMKKMHISARYQIPVAVFVIFVIGMLVSHSWITLGTIGICYLISIPICGMIFLRLRASSDKRLPQQPPLTSGPLETGKPPEKSTASTP